VNIRDPKRRFDQVHKICKPKMICEPDSTEDGNEDFNDPKAKLKIKGHGGCGNIQPEIRKEALKLNGTWKLPKGQEDEEGDKGPEKRPITPQMALNVFRNVSDRDLTILGCNADYARPEWMIMTVMPVPPPAVRPSISVDGTSQGMRSEDDLTYKLSDIIRANSNVKRCEQEGSPQHVVDEFISLLQYHVATYMDNDIAGLPKAQQKSGRPVKAIRARLKSKEGRLRGNLMGKRVDFSARTVITGDPNLSLDEVGVPRSIARTLSFPETVNNYNINKMHELVRNGPDQHPGAKYVIRDTGERIDLRHHKRPQDIQLQLGWKVERHVVDGDYIVFNRQPSLHKESMMGHRVRVMPYSTFRMNLSVTAPYNADFDGDEMNLHVPQSHETRAEVMNLCAVPLNIVSPQKNGPLMGLVQDTMAGIYKLTRRDTMLSQQEVMNTMMWVPGWDGVLPHPAILKPSPRWTGKQIISMALPSGLNILRYDDKDGHIPLKDGGLLIQDGMLEYGQLVKKVVGASGGSIVHVIFNERGPKAAVDFFDAVQRIVCYWLLHNGFSVGIGDTVPDEKTAQGIEDAVATEKAHVDDLIKEVQENRLEPLPGMTIRESFESRAKAFLEEARNQAGDVSSKGVKDFNNVGQMVKSGSKGSSVNISQMTAAVGQQSLEGKRLPFGFKYRTLPHFPKDDYSPASRGFVENSYLRGLTPTEFFFHAMGGREGLIDTAVKTAETGYIQRRLVKALEEVMVKYDGTVRNSLGDIVQFIYGEDGLDAVYIEKQSLDIINISHAKFEQKYKIDIMDPQNKHEMLTSDDIDVADEINGDNTVQQLFDDEFEAILNDREKIRKSVDEPDPDRQLPLNISRMIDAAKTKFRIKEGTRSDLDPRDVIPKVKAMLDRLIVVRGDDPLTKEADENATLLVKALYRSRLAFKKLAKQDFLNTLALDNVLGDIENRFSRALASPGEMVGVLAAQSIGEPATQMTLNTFHFAGVSAKNVTLGVPRLKEILNVAENLKTPSMKVYQEPGKVLDQENCKLLRSVVEFTSLKSVTDETEIYYDPEILETVIDADRDIVESYFILPDEQGAPPEMQSKWLLRIVLGRRQLLDKGLSVTHVASKIKEMYGKDIAVIFSDDNADEQVVRIRMITRGGDKDDDENQEEEDTLKRLETHMLDKVVLRGIDNIKRVYVASEEKMREADDGSLIKVKSDKDCKEWYLDTDGVNLKAVLGIDGIDPYRTTCNHFTHIKECFGIEATRAALIKELHAVLSFDGSYVNHRHMALLCDVMTARGTLMAVTRHGINRSDTGALMRCSFEETVEILFDAAASGELDDCRGVSENIILGQLAPSGTGEFDMLLDQKMLENVVSTVRRPMGGIAVGSATPMEGAMTPYDTGSPMADGYAGGPDYGGAAFSPMINAGQEEAGGFTAYGGFGGQSPYTGGMGGMSPGYAPTSPFSGMSPTSPGYGGYSPTSPGGGYSPTSPGQGLTSPSYQVTSPAFGSPASPAYTPTSPSYSPSSPAYSSGNKVSPTSPSYSPTSPSFSPTSPSYSPTSPNYSPTSPAAHGLGAATSPKYSPASPNYSPTSPTSPAYSPTSPNYSPTSPNFGGPNGVSPASPSYSPTSPQYNAGRNGTYSPASPAYSPASPQFSPNSPKDDSGSGS
jgi:DNA-directed RNA polymerase II subunit RPB1